MKFSNFILLFILLSAFTAANLLLLNTLATSYNLTTLIYLILEILFIVSLVLFLKSYINLKVTENNDKNLNRAEIKNDLKIIPEAEKHDKLDIEKQQDKLRYEALLANIGDGLVVSDKLGKITTFNKAAEQLLGWNEKEAIGQDLQNVVHMEYNDEHKAMKSSGKSGDFATPNKSAVGDFSLYFVRRDGTKFPAALKVTSYVQGENVLGTITLFRDVTIERNIDKMKTEFIALASHQLKTPLSAIRWYSEMLLNGDGGKLLPDQEKFASNISSSIARMNDLVNSLLNISRIESGRIIVDPQKTNIKTLVDEVVEDIKVQADQKKISLEIDVDNNLPQINLDHGLIRQVYLNLLTNAIKYTPEDGKISIKIFTKGDEIISEIKDTGYGIPSDEEARVFDKFFRGKNIVQKVPDGNGLGLYLVKSVIDLSNGKIWFKSEENHGTTFSFSLPIIGTPPKAGVVTIDS